MLSIRPMGFSTPATARVRFGNQNANPNNETEAKLKTLCPNLKDDYIKGLATFTTKLNDTGKQALFNEFETLGQLGAKDEFLNPDFARLELASLILETKWPQDFKPEDIVDDAIYVSRRRNRERGSDNYQLGLKFLVAEARQQVTAMKVEQDMKERGVNPQIIEATKKQIEKDTSWVGDILKEAIGK